ncbi:hypothetical protein BGZ60DRAFT_530040 [Tricladium varicosporioides]|nr:hypothetical protein BGZ60DRAFT_530040 [Hymenoscyphus varicosporioides]
MALHPPATNKAILGHRPYSDFVNSACEDSPDLKVLADCLNGSEFLNAKCTFTIDMLDFGSKSIMAQQQWYSDSMTKGVDAWITAHSSKVFTDEIRQKPPEGIKTRNITVCMDYQPRWGPESLGSWSDSLESYTPRSFSDVVEILGDAFNIEARFFLPTVHFIMVSASKSTNMEHFTASTHSGNRYLEMSTDCDQVHECCLSAIQIPAHGDRAYETIITLLSTREFSPSSTQSVLRPAVQPYGKQNRGDVQNVSNLLRQKCNNLTPGQIEILNNNPRQILVYPVEILYDVILWHVDAARYKMEKWGSRLNQNWGSPPVDEDSFYFDWRWYSQAVVSFEAMTRNAKRFFKVRPETQIWGVHEDSQSIISGIVSSLEDALEEAKALEVLMRENFQVHVGKVALKEARESLKQSKSVGRVTVLAFVVLPLSLVTSFFGMNIKELTDNGPQIRWFIVVAVCISLLLFLCWAMVWFISRRKRLSKIKLWDQSRHSSGWHTGW